MELPKRIVVLSRRTLPFEGLDENTRLVVSVHRERLSLLRGKVALRSMNFVMTSAVSKSIDKEVTSNTSHTAPGSSPASPLPLTGCLAASHRKQGGRSLHRPTEPSVPWHHDPPNTA